MSDNGRYVNNRTIITVIPAIPTPADVSSRIIMGFGLLYWGERIE